MAAPAAALPWLLPVRLSQRQNAVQPAGCACLTPGPRRSAPDPQSTTRQFFRHTIPLPNSLSSSALPSAPCARLFCVAVIFSVQLGKRAQSFKHHEVAWLLIPILLLFGLQRMRDAQFYRIGISSCLRLSSRRPYQHRIKLKSTLLLEMLHLAFLPAPLQHLHHPRICCSARNASQKTWHEASQHSFSLSVT